MVSNFYFISTVVILPTAGNKMAPRFQATWGDPGGMTGMTGMTRRPCEAFGSSNSNKIRHMSGTSSWVARGWPTVHGSCCQWSPCCSSMPMVQGSACSWACFGYDSVSLLLASTSWSFPEFRSGSTSNVWKSNWLTCRHNSRWFFSTTTKLKAEWFQKR